MTDAHARRGGKNKLLAVLAVLALVLAWVAPAGADPSGLNNRAFANSNKPHPDHQVLAFALATTDHQAVTAQNVAQAQNESCTGCIAEAVAFQVVLASNTSTYVLTNTATATNTNCETCTALAIAEQWVVGDTGGQVALTQVGQMALEGIQYDLQALVGAHPSTSNQSAILDLANQVSAILAADVEVVSNPSPQATPFAAASPLALPSGPGPQVQHFAQVSG